MISSIIFTKNRPMQLDLLLRSIQDNFKELDDIYILYKSTDDKFEEGYRKLISKYPAKWIKETNFKQDTINILKLISNYYCIIFADDECIVHDYSVKDCLSLFKYLKDLHSISLKHHTSISYTYTANIYSEPPEFQKYNYLYVWNWKEYPNPNAEYGYPSSINSTIYTKIFLEYFANTLYYNNLNDLEGQLNLNRNMFRSKIACFEKPKTICIANNLVQTGGNRHSEDKTYLPENLNEIFLNGFQISTKNLYDKYYNSVTLEVPYIFEKV